MVKNRQCEPITHECTGTCFEESEESVEDPPEDPIEPNMPVDPVDPVEEPEKIPTKLIEEIFGNILFTINS